MARAGYGRNDRRQNALDSEQDRKDFLAELAKDRNGYSPKHAAAKVGISVQTYYKWRKRYPDFRAACEAIKPPERRVPGREYTAGFVAFRKEYLGFDTPQFQVEMCQAYESTAPGNILLILVPPEHGKTTLFEDYATYKICTDPNWRNTTGSEKLTMARKMLTRVKRRLQTNSKLLRDFGPFRAGSGDGKAEQPWAADYFTVARATHDERDYTMCALGFGAAIAGTRADHLHCDDLQSRKSINQTASMLEDLHQDWFTRPGESGISTINGTRVGEGDIYEGLEEALPPNILRVIKMPMIVTDDLSGNKRPLWPEKYSMEEVERIRVKATEPIWHRTYMQAPSASTSKTFTDQVIEPALNPNRALREPVAHLLGHTVLSLDPALGGSLPILGATLGEQRLWITYLMERRGIGRFEEIWDMVADACSWAHARGVPVTDLVIESNAMQKGLARDDRLWQLADNYGFQVHEHLTGVDKYDPAMGVPSMARDLRLANIDIPYANHPDTRIEIDELIRQLKKWRPNVKGTVLRQDRVMALWFLWILWRDRRGTEVANPNQFQREGLAGFSERSSGLVVPTSALVENSLVMGSAR